MNNSTPRTQEIDLLDMIWYLVYHWRSIIATTLVFMLLAGCLQGMKIVSHNKNVDAAIEEQRIEEEEQKAKEEEEQQKEEVEKEQEELLEEDKLNAYADKTNAQLSKTYNKLTSSEAVSVDYAIIYAKQLQMYLDYKATSVYINLDAYNEKIQTLNYLIKVDTSDLQKNGMEARALADALRQSYVYYVNSGAIASDVKEIYGNVKEASLCELISAEGLLSTDNSDSSQSGSFTENGLTTSFHITSDSNTTNAYALFMVKVAGKTAGDAKVIAEAFDSALAKYTESVGETLGKHSITLCNSYSSTIVNKDLMYAQINLDNSIINTRNSLNNTVAAFNEMQRKAYEELTGTLLAGSAPETVDVIAPAPTTDETGETVETVYYTEADKLSLKRGVVKYAILGIFGGIFVMCMFWAMIYILAGTIKTTRDLTCGFGYYLFADLSVYEDRKKRLGWQIDSLLDRIRLRNKVSREEEATLMATNIKVTCEKNNVTSVYLTSTAVLSEGDKQMIYKLMEDLKRVGIAADFGGTIVRDSASYEKMIQTGNVVYVEKMRVSRVEDLIKAGAMTENQGVKVLGVVAV